MVSIIEKSSISKSGIELTNEDGIFVSDKYIAVIDGATSKDDCRHDNKTGGQIVKEIIMNSLEQLCGDESYYEAVQYIQNRIVEMFPMSSFFSASASAVIYSVNRHQVWFVGDCQATIDGRLHNNPKEIDYIFSKVRAIAISSLLISGKSVEELENQDSARELILPLLKSQTYLENANDPYGYLVFNNKNMPKEVLEEKGKIVNAPLGSEVVLASDGYPVLHATLKETEEALEKMAEEDPLCYRELLGTKGISKGNAGYDDRTYIRFSTY